MHSGLLGYSRHTVHDFYTRAALHLTVRATACFNDRHVELQYSGSTPPYGASYYLVLVADDLWDILLGQHSVLRLELLLALGIEILGRRSVLQLEPPLASSTR